MTDFFLLLRNPVPIFLPIYGRKLDLAESGIPIDVSRANLFDIIYFHATFKNLILWFSSRITAGMDQWIGRISHKRYQPSKSESFNVYPFVGQPHRPKPPGSHLWLYSLRSALVQTPLAPWSSKITCDVVSLVNAHGCRAHLVASQADIHDIWKRDEHTVGFVGFVRPSLGATQPSRPPPNRISRPA
ncbi:hypothetical protein EDB80DRAFT_745802 [Ilyonectria destructans]|nr:hypothetical protein EDB80DRAFT_745802 [Ilyonectria destructans]